LFGFSASTKKIRVEFAFIKLLSFSDDEPMNGADEDG
jgi:hypothetical protein